MRFKSLIILILFPLFSAAQGESPTRMVIDGGASFKKYAGFYWMNGVSAEMRSEKFLKEKVSVGLNFQTSLLGSALASNAISTFETEVYLVKYFRRAKHLKPLLRLNTGIAFNSYGSAEFQSLPSSGMLLSLETGLRYQLPFAERRSALMLSGGYNFITGDGLSGLGTIYPLFARISVLYRLSK
jgi:hypothetical protein